MGKRNYRPSELAEKIDQAADLLEDTGWCRGVLRNVHDHHCLAGSVYGATGCKWEPAVPVVVRGHQVMAHDVVRTTKLADQTMNVLEEYASATMHRDMIVWNDEQKDKRKVVRFMRRAARDLRNGKFVRRTDKPPFDLGGWQVAE